MWLVAGLGNPGPKYENTRHNIGFLVIDELADRRGLGPFKARFGGEIATGSLAGRSVVLLKPMEFMNVSGHAVQRTAHFYSVETSDIIVVHDDIDLPFARLRLKKGGGHGGHNGLRSIHAQLGATDYHRVRVGVGKPEKQDGSPGDGRVSKHVLSRFASDEAADVDALVRRAADAVEAILDRGITSAMNDFNAAPKSEQPEKSDGGEAPEA